MRVTKKLLFLEKAEGLDLYPYFEAAIYPERASERLLPLPLDRGTDYYLPLPLPLVSPRIYLGEARLAAALGMEKDVFASLCRTMHAINPEIPAQFEYPTEIYRDDFILKSAGSEGFRGPRALFYLCERYLDGLTLRSDAVIVALRVDYGTAAALAENGEDFLKDPLRKAYAQTFTRIVRLTRVTVLKAPDIIIRNEIMLLHKALERLVSLAPFDLE